MTTNTRVNDPCPVDGCIHRLHGSHTPHRDRQMVEWYGLRSNSGPAFDLVEPLEDAERCNQWHRISNMRCVLPSDGHFIHCEANGAQWAIPVENTMAGEPLKSQGIGARAEEIRERFLTKSPILEAHHLVHGIKRTNYGDPKESFEKLASLWSVVLGMEVSVSQVALCLIQLKVSRELFGHSHDSLVDIAGYAEVLSMALGESL